MLGGLATPYLVANDGARTMGAGGVTLLSFSNA
jgi:hypothetical protein